MSTNKLSPNLLLQISLCNTPEPFISRILSVPSQMTFTELHEAIGVAFGWNIEPCTSWVFNAVDQDPLTATKHDGSHKLKTTFTAFWTAPNQRYNMLPAEHGTQLAIGRCMEKARAGRYWTYDYNISKEPHAITVIDTLPAGPAPELTCVGGFGHIDRSLWQLASLIGHGHEVKAEHCTWVMDLVGLNFHLREIGRKFDARKRRDANAAPKTEENPKKRAKSSEGGSADVDEVIMVPDGPAQKKWMF